MSNGASERAAASAIAHVAIPVTISWGAVFGGAVAALAIWGMLATLGIALGLSAVDPNDAGSLRSSGIFTGIWGLVAPLIALFVGGMIAGAAARVTSKTGGVVHGLVMWGVTTLVGAWGLSLMLSSVVSGVASIGKTAVTTGAQAVARSAGAASGLGIDADAVLRPVNERLRSEGKPALTAEELQAATGDAIRRAVREGSFDRQTVVESLTAATDLSRQDAETIAAEVETQVNGARQKMQQTADAVQEQALRAADTTGKAMWGVFGALLLGMLSAIAGATVGEVRSQRLWEQWFSRDATPRTLIHESGVRP